MPDLYYGKLTLKGREEQLKKLNQLLNNLAVCNAPINASPDYLPGIFSDYPLGESVFYEKHKMTSSTEMDLFYCGENNLGELFCAILCKTFQFAGRVVISKEDGEAWEEQYTPDIEAPCCSLRTVANIS